MKFLVRPSNLRLPGSRLTLVALLVVRAFAPAAAYAQSFVNVTTQAGINHSFTPTGSLGGGRSSIESYAGGAAAGDYDGDGWVDLYVTRFWDSDILYRNNHDGTFSNVTGDAFGPAFGVHQTNGAGWGDVDNDGDLDLFVSTFHEARHLLYLNDGAGHFSEEGGSRGVTLAGGLATTSGTSVAMGDYDRDGYLDMYVAEWRSFSVDAIPAQSRLLRNQGAANPGHFVDVTASAGVAMDRSVSPFANKSLAYTPRFADLDRDGFPDLAVVSDAGTTRLFWNDGDGTFTDGTATAGDLGVPAFPPRPGVVTGAATDDMGLTFADFNGDGLLDWFSTSIGSGSGVYPSGNRIFLNNGDRTFHDATDATGVREGGWGWGADAFDADNDGDYDIVHTNGFSSAEDDQSVFFKNVGDRTHPVFVNGSTAAGITDQGQGRGLLTLDYDRDGDLDVFIVNLGSAPILYRNDVGIAAGDWLQIHTIGTESNRDGIGALVTVTPDLAHPEVTFVAEIDGSSNYLGQSELIAHVGLGEIASIDEVDIVWPSGLSQRFHDVLPNQRISIVEGLLADANGNDVVDVADLMSWHAHFALADGATAADGDANRDGIVDGADLLRWQRDLGRHVVSGILSLPVRTVPEPGVAALAAFSVAMGGSLRPRAPFGGPGVNSRKIERRVLPRKRELDF